MKNQNPIITTGLLHVYCLSLRHRTFQKVLRKTLQHATGGFATSLASFVAWPSLWHQPESSLQSRPTSPDGEWLMCP